MAENKLPKKLTPMLRQYMAIKANYQDTILLFRLGDFYEMFGSDAEISSQVLHIALTARHKGSENEIAMCGFPHFSAEQYIKKLIKAGQKVAICDQTSDSSLPGIVERQVTRVITPGTIVSDTEEEHKIRLLAAISKNNNAWEIAFCNVSTGEIFPGGGTTIPDLIDQIRIRDPQEILIHHDHHGIFVPIIEQGHIRGLLTNVTTKAAAQDMIGTYIRSTQQSTAEHLYHSAVEESKKITIDEITVRNLELVRNNHDGKVYGSLLDTINATITAHGYRLLHSMLLHPLAEREAIQSRLNFVEALKEKGQLRRTLQANLKCISDIEKIIAKIVLRSASPRDLGALLQTFHTLPQLLEALKPEKSAVIQSLIPGIAYQGAVSQLLENAIEMENLPQSAEEGNWIKGGFDKELDAIKNTFSQAQDWLKNYEDEEKKKIGTDQIKVRFNNITGFFLEISKANLKNIPVERTLHLTRKQTLVNAERFASSALYEFEAEYVASEEKSRKRQAVIFQSLCADILKEKDLLQILAKKLAELDVWVSLAHIADLQHYVRPEFSSDGKLEIEAGRHPIIAKKLGNSFVPNDTKLNHEDEQLVLITGPNMGGKSTYLRQVALIEILFLMGSFVPAKRASLPIIDRLFTRIGAQDHLLRGMSTFMVEMTETANILNHATKDSLIILDEIGRGTSTYDGLSIAWAICEYLIHHIQAKTLFASHYHELINVVESLPKAENASVAIAEYNKQITFLYKVIPGGIGKSYGVEVAKRAGLPLDVLDHAQNILASLEKDSFHSSSSPAPIPAQLIVPPTPLSPSSPSSSPSPSSFVLDQLLDINIDSLTPLDALMKLKDMQEKIKTEKDNL